MRTGLIKHKTNSVGNVSYQRSYSLADAPAHSWSELYDTLHDSNKSIQLRHYITNICSQENTYENDDTRLFCENLLKTYILLQISYSLYDKLNPAINLWTHKFNNSIDLIIEHALE